MEVRLIVRALRAKKGWSQAKLARESGVGLSMLKQLENGKRNAGRDTMKRLSKALLDLPPVFLDLLATESSTLDHLEPVQRKAALQVLGVFNEIFVKHLK